MDEESDEDSPCFFFKVPGSRKFYTDTFSATHPQVEKGRTVVSIIQLAMLDQSVETKARSNKIKLEEAIGAAASGDEAREAGMKDAKENFKSSSAKKKKGANGLERKGKSLSGEKQATTEKLAMAATAAGSIDSIKVCASSIASDIWDRHVGETGGTKLQNRSKLTDDGEQPQAISQPCECCWVVDVQRPGSPVTEMFKKYEQGQSDDDDGPDASEGEAGDGKVVEVVGDSP